jgi:pimeloyl-ACP methyl ester carboxylesterase
MNRFTRLFGSAALAASLTFSLPAFAESNIAYRTASVDGTEVFYREAGPKDAPTILLLHGFPTSSAMFRNLIPALSEKYHVVAPDLPGFGFTKPASGFTYTFDNLAKVIDRFTEVKGISRFAIYVFDYGAPTGWRIASAHPERITAIITQNGNAYEEGLNEKGWKPIQTYWKEPTQGNRDALRGFLKLDITRFQYFEGVKDADKEKVSPDGYTIDQALLDRPGQEKIQLDLFLDYRNNVAAYPRYHDYFKAKQPPLLAVWGQNDPFFLPAGANAFKRDIPNAEVIFFDTGHFALETHNQEIAAKILDFMARNVKQGS